MSTLTQIKLRTVEKHFEDSVKVKIRLATRSMPVLNISPSKSSYENTGGLCGMWDNNRQTELFVLDQDGIEEYLPRLNDVRLARDFWRLENTFRSSFKVYHTTLNLLNTLKIEIILRI